MAALPDDDERLPDAMPAPDAQRAAERQRDAALRFISHDMRSPQSSILSLLELYDRSPVDKRDAALLHERIRRYARHALDLSEDFLQMARAEAGGLELQVHDLHGLLDEAADTVWANARARQIRVVLPEPETEADCRVDRTLITRAFVLLLEEVLASSPDGAEIRCELASTGTAEGGWQVSVRAPGPQGLDSSSPALKFAQLAAQAHGGTARVQDGAEFRICLPRDGKRADSAPNHEQPLPV